MEASQPSMRHLGEGRDNLGEGKTGLCEVNLALPLPILSLLGRNSVSSLQTLTTPGSVSVLPDL